MTIRRCGRLLVLLACFASAAANAATLEEAQDQALRTIQELVAGGKIAQAQAMVEAARKNAGTNAARVVYALEQQLVFLIATENFKDALPISNEVLQLRRQAMPQDWLGLGIALHEHVIVEVGNGHIGEADKAFFSSLDAFRQAFGPDDTRRAVRLEAAAGFIATASGFARPRLALDLYKEAIEVRRRAKDGRPEKLAEALQSAAMIEMRTGEAAVAAGRLAEATQLLIGAVAAAKDKAYRNVLSGGLADLLVLRAGIAAHTGNVVAGNELIEQARAVLPRSNTDDVLGLKLEIALIRSQVKESAGDLDGALQEVADEIDTVMKLSGDQRLLAGDVIEEYGVLSLAHGDLDEAEKALDIAVQLKGSEPTSLAPLLMAQGQLAERRGKLKEAEALYRRSRDLHRGDTTEVEILFGTNRKAIAGPGLDFGPDRGDAIQFGKAFVIVPGGPGSTEADLAQGSAALADSVSLTAAGRLFVTQASLLDRDQFGADASARLHRASRYPDAALVFVHGFGTRFASGVARAGQITRDLDFDGPAFVFSWPSQGRVAADAYWSDQQNAVQSVEALKEFLQTVAATSGARKIHIIAHSMGNRVLLPAIAGLKSDPGIAGHLGEIVFASPDVDQAEFVARTSDLKGLDLTLYASGNDRALWASWFANLFSTRAGYVAHGLLTSGTPVLVAGVDSIDVSAAGQDLLSLNHDLYAANPAIATDLKRLLQSGTHPPELRSRDMLVKRTTASGSYWIYRPQ